MIKVGLIGCGYWGPNLARSLEMTKRVNLTCFCDPVPDRSERLAVLYPGSRTTTNPEDLFQDPAIDAVVVSTPVATHFKLGMRALDSGKHLLIEKPIATNYEEALLLAQKAAEVKRILLVGHVFAYNSSLDSLRNIISQGDLGEIYYLNFEWTNLGPIRQDANSLWDLGSHCIAIMNDLLADTPVAVSAYGKDFFSNGVEDVCFATFNFASGPVAHVHASWLNPTKVRRITVVGSVRMAVWDDLDLVNPLKIWDKNVTLESPTAGKGPLGSFMSHKITVHDGGCTIPRVPLNQPLFAECEHFVRCVEQSEEPRTGGAYGADVVRILERASDSMKNGGVLSAIQKKI